MLRVLVATLVLLSSVARAESPKLAQTLESVLATSKLPPNAKVAISVRTMSDGKLVFQKQGDRPQSLASGTKIITLAAALSTLGASFAFSTEIATDDPISGGAIGKGILVSRADPKLTSADLADLARQVRRQGIRRIGTLCIDDSYFDDNIWPPHYDEQPKEYAYFRAPVAATNLHNNTVSVWVSPSQRGTGSSVMMVPKNNYVTVENKVTTIESGRSALRLKTKATGGKWTLTISGSLVRGNKPVRIRRLVPDPRAFLLSAAQTAFKSEGVRVARTSSKTCNKRSSAHVIARNSAARVGQLAAWVGKYSSNFHAELLLKTMGAERKKTPGTWKAGVAVVNEYLAGLGLPGQFRYGNGSGLFDSSSFSANQMTLLLHKAGNDFRVGPDLMRALSTGGEDGTLRRRFAKSVSRGRLRAKTGTLANVSTLSGYLGKDVRKTLAFSILIEDLPDKWRARHQARLLQDALIEAMHTHLTGERNDDTKQSK